MELSSQVLIPGFLVTFGSAENNHDNDNHQNKELSPLICVSANIGNTQISFSIFPAFPAFCI